MHTVSSDHKYPSANYCIYCGATDVPLTDEHIVPFSLGGRLIFPRASCAECQAVTAGITQVVARSMYGNLRVRLGVPTRRPKERPKKLPLKLRDNLGNEREIQIPSKLWPRSYPVLILPEPAILTGETPKTWQVQIRDHREDFDKLYQGGFVRLNENILFSPMINAKIFCRQLAQIAYAHVIATIGRELYQDLLVPIIMDRIDESAHVFMFIGGVKEGEEINSSMQLSIVERRGIRFIRHLFSMPQLGWKFPTYQTICGIVTDDTAYMKIVSLMTANG
jgi:hypothetical protein